MKSWALRLRVREWECLLFGNAMVFLRTSSTRSLQQGESSLLSDLSSQDDRQDAWRLTSWSVLPALQKESP